MDAGATAAIDFFFIPFLALPSSSSSVLGCCWVTVRLMFFLGFVFAVDSLIFLRAIGSFTLGSGGLEGKGQVVNKL
jgi:hypothetical protein